MRLRSEARKNLLRCAAFLLLVFGTVCFAHDGDKRTDSKVSREDFGRHVDLHVRAVQRISRIWWNQHKDTLFPGATDQEKELLLDFLSEYSRQHDVSKRGTAWRNDERFRADFDALERDMNLLKGRTGRPGMSNAPLKVERGCDLLHDLMGIKIFDPRTPPDQAAIGKRVVDLLNRIDAAATEELVNSPAYAKLQKRWLYAIVGGISIADLTHRHLASRSGPVTVTALEFGGKLLSTAEFLEKQRTERGAGVPGVPSEYKNSYSVDAGIAHARLLENNPEVLAIVRFTSLREVRPPLPGCLWSLFDVGVDRGH